MLTTHGVRHAIPSCERSQIAAFWKTRPDLDSPNFYTYAPGRCNHLRECIAIQAARSLLLAIARHAPFESWRHPPDGSGPHQPGRYRRRVSVESREHAGLVGGVCASPARWAIPRSRASRAIPDILLGSLIRIVAHDRARSNGQKDVSQRCHVNDNRHQTDHDRRREGLDDAPQSGHLQRSPVVSGRRWRHIGHISYLNCFHARFSFHGRMRKTARNSIIRRQSAEIARSGWGVPLTGASQMRRLSRNDR